MKKVIIVRMQGGIGNQLFQYAFYLNLISKRKNVYLDFSHFSKYSKRPLKIFEAFEFECPLAPSNIVNQYLQLRYPRFIYRLFNRPLRLISNYQIMNSNNIKYIFKENDNLHPEAYKYIRYGYLDGYWQSEIYFDNIIQNIPSIFKFKTVNNISVLQMKTRILNSNNNTSLHWRRGDYVGHKNSGINLESYFENSLKYMISKKNIKDVFVFTEDPKWVKQKLENYCLNINFVHVSEELSNHEDYHELFLMTLCKNNIISNSSFSWWGAYLNRYDQKMVIAPDKWTLSGDFIFRDSLRTPNDWIKVSTK